MKMKKKKIKQNVVLINPSFGKFAKRSQTVHED